MKNVQQHLSLKDADYFFKIALFFYEGSLTGEKDYKEALKNFHKADGLNHPHTAEYLAQMYWQGIGTKRNPELAASYLEQCAMRGNLEAQYAAGVIYQRGIGVLRDYQLAKKWLRRAAKRGYSPAEYLLGLMYFYGKGYGRDFSQARKWFEKAAMLDWFTADLRSKNPPCVTDRASDRRAEALCKLCEISAKGLDKTSDLAEAYQYYEWAMECCPKKANAVLFRLSPEQGDALRVNYLAYQKKLTAEKMASKALRAARHPHKNANLRAAYYD